MNDNDNKILRVYHKYINDEMILSVYGKYFMKYTYFNFWMWAR